ncbi:MAG: alpha-E domain-containing protein [Gemmatimonadaceae bacterium]
MMLCRVAEDVLWMSRYVERSLAVGRLIEVSQHLEFDEDDDPELRAARWAPLLAQRPHDAPLPAMLAEVTVEREAARTVRQWLVFHKDNPRSIVACIDRARSAARQVRERISSEMWETLNSLHLFLSNPALPEIAERNPHAFFQRIRNEAQLIQGLADATLAHDECWRFVRLGTFLERADNVAHVLALQAHLLRDDGAAELDMVRWIGVLRSCGAAEGYARYYSLRVEPARVVEFLLLNAQFPQSVRFSLRQAWDALRALNSDHTIPEGPRYAGSSATRALGLLTAQLEHAAVDDIIESGLQDYLHVVQRDLANVTDHVTRVYLRDEPHQGRLVGAVRARRLMAEQQQQRQDQ